MVAATFTGHRDRTICAAGAFGSRQLHCHRISYPISVHLLKKGKRCLCDSLSSWRLPVLQLLLLPVLPHGLTFYALTCFAVLVHQAHAVLRPGESATGMNLQTPREIVMVAMSVGKDPQDLARTEPRAQVFTVLRAVNASPHISRRVPLHSAAIPQDHKNIWIGWKRWTT